MLAHVLLIHSKRFVVQRSENLYNGHGVHSTVIKMSDCDRRVAETLKTAPCHRSRVYVALAFPLRQTDATDVIKLTPDLDDEAERRHQQIQHRYLATWSSSLTQMRLGYFLYLKEMI